MCQLYSVSCAVCRLCPALSGAGNIARVLFFISIMTGREIIGIRPYYRLIEPANMGRLL